MHSSGDGFSLTCDIATPERLELSVSAQIIIVPGAEGEFGVLPGHAPFISALRPGVITIQSPNHDTRRFAVVSGIADVAPQCCTIMAEYVRDISGQTLADAQREVTEARAAVEAAVTDSDRDDARRNLALAEAAVIGLA